MSLKSTLAGFGLLLSSIAMGQTTYYSKPGANLAANLPANWSTTRDGSGSSPANFTSGDNFVVQAPANGTTNMITSAAFTISGTNSGLKIESGALLTANHAITIAAAGTFQLESGATYEHNYSTAAASTTIFGGVESFDAASTVRILNWNGTSAAHTGVTPSAVANAVTYCFGNLEIARPGLVATWTQTAANLNWAAGNVTISSLGAGGTVNIVSGGTITVNIGGTLSMTSPTGTLQLASSTTSPTVNVGGFNLSAGTFNYTSSTGSPTLGVTGSYTVSGGTINTSGTGNGILAFKGTSLQTVTVSGSPVFSTTAGRQSIVLNNAAGINLTGNLWVTGNHATAAATMTVTAGSISGSGSIQYGGTGTGSAQGSTSLIYATAASYSATAAEFPATNGPTGLTVNVGAGNTLSFPAAFNRSLSKQLAMTSGHLAIGSGNMLSLTNSTLAGQLAYTAGNFITSGGLARNFPTTGLPTTSNSVNGRFPFGISTQADRSVYVYFSAATLSGGSSGLVSISYNPAAGATTGLSVTDNGVTLDRRSNTGWAVTTGTLNTGSSTMALSVWATYIGSAGTINQLRLTDGAAGFGTLVASTGTAQAPVLGKSELQASDIDGKTLYLGSSSVNSLARSYVAVTGASNWGDPASWVDNDGTIPGASNDAIIPGGNSMVLQGSIAGPYTCGNLWFSGGAGVATLTAGAGEQLTVSSNIGNSISGALNVSGGTVLVNGNISNNSTLNVALSSGVLTVAGTVNSATTANNTPATYAISGGAFSAGSINTNNTTLTNTALTFNVSGGTMAVSGNIATTTSNLVLIIDNAAVTAGGIASTTSLTTTLNGGTLTVSGNVAGANNFFTQNGGTFTVTGSYTAGAAATTNFAAGTATMTTVAIGSTSANAFKVNGGTVTVTGAAGTGISWTANGTLSVPAGTLTVGPSGGGNRTIAQSTGTLTLSGGDLALNGNYLQSGGTFNMSGGTFGIDGNDGTLVGSVGGASSLFGINGGAQNVSAGTITITDPIFPDAGNTGSAIYHNSASTNTWSGGTLLLGNGISTQPGTTGKGFTIECSAGAGRLTLANVIGNTNSTDRCLYGPITASGEANVGGNFTLASGQLFNDAATGSFNVGGNITNNGVMTIARQLGMRRSGGLASTVQQSIGGSGSFESGIGLADNLVKALVVNNTNASGLTIAGINGVTGSLTLTAGRVLMGNNDFIVNAGATTSGTPSSTNLFVQDGTGRFRRGITTTGNVTYVFPVGTYDGANYAYTGASLLFASNSLQRTLTLTVTPSTHPDMQTGTTSADYLQRYWSFTDDQAGNGTYSWRPTFRYSNASPNDVTGIFTELKVSFWNGAAWNMFSTTSTVTASTIALSANVTQATGPIDGTAWTGRRDGATSYVWTGAVSAAWNDPANWTGGAGDFPNSASDNVQISAGTPFSPEINALTISVNALSVGAGANLTVKGNGTLNISDNVSWAGTATLAGSTIRFVSATNPQTIPALNYQNLALAGAGDKSFSPGTTGISGSLAIAGAAPTVAGSTIRYNGTASQTILNTAYDNLEITGSRGAGNISFASGTLTIAGTFAPQATFGTGNYAVNASNTINYNGTAAQTIAPFNYRNLTVSGDRAGALITLGNGTIQASGTVTWSATNYLQDAGTGTVRLNGTSQVVPTLSYYNLDLGSATTPSFAAGSLSIGNVFTAGPATSTGAALVTFNGGAQSIPGLTYAQLTLSGSGTKTFAGTTAVTGSLAIGGGVDIDLNGQNLSVGGDWTNDGTFAASSGAVTFNGAGSQALNSVTTEVFYNLSVNKAGGTLTLNAPIVAVNALNLVAGSVANGYNITLQTGTTLDRNAGSLDAAPVFGSEVDVHYGNSGNITAGFEMPAADIVRNLTLTGGGTVTLNRNVNVNGQLVLTSGIMDVASFNLSVAAGAINGGSTTAYVRTSGAGGLTVRGVGASATAFPVGNSTYNPLDISNPVTLDWTVRVEDGVSNVVAPYAINLAKAVSRQWDITPSQGSPAPGGGATITFYYNGTSDVGGSFSNAVNVQLWHYDAVGGWARRGSSAAASNVGGMKAFTVGGLTYFSPYALSNVDGPLPVTLLSFTGKRNGAVNELKWTTASESNSRGFAVERSSDGVTFTQVTFVTSRANGGNSTSDLSYTYNESIAAGAKWYYRLKQVDLDGQYKYSEVLLLKGDKGGFITVEGIYPNPVKATANIRIQAGSTGGNIVLQLTDMQGRIVRTQSVNTEAGAATTIQMDMGGLAAGQYHLKAIAGEEVSETVTVIKN